VLCLTTTCQNSLICGRFCTAKHRNVDAILDLLELVVGVAMKCDRKAEFIENIFSLPEDSQIVLKELVQRVLLRVNDLEVDVSVDVGTCDERVKQVEQDLFRQVLLLSMVVLACLDDACFTIERMN
jgi:hypothetical protein